MKATLNEIDYWLMEGVPWDESWYGPDGSILSLEGSVSYEGQVSGGVIVQRRPEANMHFTRIILRNVYVIRVRCTLGERGEVLGRQQ